jgi:hypothetical protein
MISTMLQNKRTRTPKATALDLTPPPGGSSHPSPIGRTTTKGASGRKVTIEAKPVVKPKVKPANKAKVKGKTTKAALIESSSEAPKSEEEE